MPPDLAAKSHIIPSQALWVAGSLGQGLSRLWAGCRPGWGRWLPQAPETSWGGGAGLRRGPGTGGLLPRRSKSPSCLAPSPLGTGGHVLSEAGALPDPARPHPEDWGGWGEAGRQGLPAGHPQCARSDAHSGPSFLLLSTLSPCPPQRSPSSPGPSRGSRGGAWAGAHHCTKWTEPCPDPAPSSVGRVTLSQSHLFKEPVSLPPVGDGTRFFPFFSLILEP